MKRIVFLVMELGIALLFAGFSEPGKPPEKTASESGGGEKPATEPAEKKIVVKNKTAHESPHAENPKKAKPKDAAAVTAEPIPLRRAHSTVVTP